MMSSITFEPSIPNSCPVSSMLLDSNTGNTCAASSVANGSQMYYNNNAIFTSQQAHHHHNISPLVYTNMACSTTGESSTTSSVSSSHTRLQQFDAVDMPNELMYNPNLPNDQYKTEEGEDLEAIPRDRCNTWPMRRPVVETQTSPLIHEQIPEEDSLYGSGEQMHEQQQTATTPQQGQQQYNSNLTYNNNQSSTCDEENDQFDDLSPGAELGEGGSGKKQNTRRNAWGNLSYADLITQAILSSPEQRLTLSQVYEWMVQNVPYFSNKGDSNSSAGWKNSIRHNLSLHNRFMRIQNEGAGKSSWWTINPEAKPGRNPRRRAATMESSTKVAIDKKRRGARKRLEVNGICGSTKGLNDSVAGSQLSITSQDLFNDGNDDSLGPDFERFRARTQSNLSMPGKSSPHYDDFEFPSWANSSNNLNSTLSSQLGPINSNVNELLSRTDQMRLDSVDVVAPPEFCGSNNPLKGSLQPRQSPLQMTIQNLKQEEIKQEPIVMQQQPPPSYQDVIQNQNPMRPLMHSQIQAPQMMQQKMMPSNGTAQQQFYQTSVYNMSMSSQMINQQPINGQPPMTNTTSMNNQTPMNPLWTPMQSQPQQMIYNQPPQFGQPPISNGSNMMMMNGRSQMGLQLPSIGDLSQPDLPNDLANLTNLDSQLFMDTDVEAIMRTL